MNTPINRGAALSGGGGRGWFQDEVIQILDAAGITFQALTGNSVGGLNTYMYAAGKLDLLHDIWQDITTDMVYRGRLTPWRVIWSLAMQRSHLLDIRPLEKMIQDIADKPADILSTVGWIDMLDGEYYPTRLDGQMLTIIHNSLLATALMPIIWKPVALPGLTTHAVDGGLRNQSPLRDLFKLSAFPSLGEGPGVGHFDEIWVINCNPRKLQPWKGGKLIPTLMRTAEIIMNENLREDVRMANKLNRMIGFEGADGLYEPESGKTYDYVPIHVIEPEYPIDSLLDFTTRKHRGHGKEVAEKYLDAHWKELKL